MNLAIESGNPSCFHFENSKNSSKDKPRTHWNWFRTSRGAQNSILSSRKSRSMDAIISRDATEHYQNGQIETEWMPLRERNSKSFRRLPAYSVVWKFSHVCDPGIDVSLKRQFEILSGISIWSVSSEFLPWENDFEVRWLIEKATSLLSEISW